MSQQVLCARCLCHERVAGSPLCRQCRMEPDPLGSPRDVPAWGDLPKHCIYCGGVGPRTITAHGLAHKRCLR